MGARCLQIAALVLSSDSCFFKPAVDVDAFSNGAGGADAGQLTYEVNAPVHGSRTLSVEATFERANTERLTMPNVASRYIRDVQALVVADGTYRNIERRSGDTNEWVEPSCAKRCTVRYRIDLGELAAGCGDEVDCARRVADATLAPSLSWLMYPTSPRSDVPVTVRVHANDAAEFASGMTRSSSRRVSAGDAGSVAETTTTTFSFRSYDMDEGSFTAFGPMRRHTISVKGLNNNNTNNTTTTPARIDIFILGASTSYAVSDVTLRSWIEERANAIVPLFGRFPVDNATVFVVPAKDANEVVFGKVLSLAGASVVLVVGDKMGPAALKNDWVLIHEFIHLGFPTFRGEGRWLSEGLATYYEPILRARAGWKNEGEVFHEFGQRMQDGQPYRGSTSGRGSVGGGGLALRRDLASIYWGGALFCLAADVRIREETHGKRSLDDVIRAVLARGGDATKVWSMRDVIRLGDIVTGTTVLSDMFEHHAAHDERIDLEELFSRLGVSTKVQNVGSSTLENRSLAQIRHDIVVNDAAPWTSRPRERDEATAIAAEASRPQTLTR